MPYIKQEYRTPLDPAIWELSDKIVKVYRDSGAQTRDGLLNYSITMLLKDIYPNANYHDYNEIIGMLECCKLEFYRKFVSPYEDEKEMQNGRL